MLLKEESALWYSRKDCLITLLVIKKNRISLIKMLKCLMQGIIKKG